MGKLSDTDINAMLKRIQDNVDKQTASDKEEKNISHEGENTPAQLIDKLKAHVGENKTVDAKVVSEADDYDISGFEIEDTEDESEEAVEESSDASVEISDENVDDRRPNEETEPEKLNSLNDEITEKEVLDEKRTENTVDGVEAFVEEAKAEESENESEVEAEVEEPEALSEIISCQPDKEVEKEQKTVDPVFKDEEDSPKKISDVSSSVETDLYDELSANEEENTDEGQFDAENPDGEEAVRKRIEQFVNETLEPAEDFIFFESLDKRSGRGIGDEDRTAKRTTTVSEESVAVDTKKNIDTTSGSFENVTLSFKKQPLELEVEDVSVGAEDVGARKELDDADINFAISLGSKDALESAMGFAKVRAAKHNFVNPAVKDAVGNIILNKQREYRSYDQNAEIKDSYRKEKKKIGERLIFTSLILLVLLFCETVFSFESVNIPYVSDFLDIPFCYYIVSTVLFLISVALSAYKLFYGITGFLTTRAHYYTPIGFVSIINTLYNLFVLIAFGSENLPMFNSVCVFGLVVSIIGEYMQVSREIRTFNLVSDDRPKISLERVDRSIETIKKESYLRSNEFFVENTNFVGKYFERSARSPESYHVKYTYITLTMLLSLLVSAVAIIMTRTFSSFVLAFELSALLCVPVQFMLLGTYQFYIISKKLYRDDSAMIGETIADEYVGSNTIYLDDVEVFDEHGVRVINLESFNNFNIIDINYYYLSVFSSIEGPLKNAFGEVPQNIKISDNVKLLNVYQGGIEALVDGKSRISLGNADFLSGKGVHLGRSGEEKHHEKDETCVMFMAVNNALCAKLHLKYSISYRFESFAEDMAENHAQVGVRTVDPNITEEMLAALRGDQSDAIKVMRPTPNDLVPIGRRSDSGVITAKNPHMIAKILAEGIKVKRINSVINILWAVYAIVGMCSVILFSVSGSFSAILPTYIITYEILWTVGGAIYIFNKLRNRKSK